MSNPIKKLGKNICFCCEIRIILKRNWVSITLVVDCVPINHIILGCIWIVKNVLDFLIIKLKVKDKVPVAMEVHNRIDVHRPLIAQRTWQSLYNGMPYTSSVFMMR